MRNLRAEIESLHYLSAFEAAARLASFTRAAAELGISQSAVSQAVRRLEAAIGVELFDRQHRRIVLTQAGQSLYGDVSDAFARILARVQELKRQGQSERVVLSLSSAFATHWMLPRLQRFQAARPGIDLRLQTADRDLDLLHEEIALGVRGGSGLWPGYHAAKLSDERQIAVASPRWLKENGPVSSLEALKACRLVHLDEPYRKRTSWADWFSALGESPILANEGLRLNDYALVLQAAIAGEGVALGWMHLCKPLLEKGLLAPVGPWLWSSGAGFYLVWPDAVPLRPDAIRTRDWMIAEAATDAA
jgi:DNA-binding transcriptional LysR family regulator